MRDDSTMSGEPTDPALDPVYWQAFSKMMIIEDTAKTQMAAIIAGKPQPLDDAGVAHVRGMEVEAYRRKIIEGK